MTFDLFPADFPAMRISREEVEEALAAGKCRLVWATDNVRGNRLLAVATDGRDFDFRNVSWNETWTQKPGSIQEIEDAVRRDLQEIARLYARLGHH